MLERLLPSRVSHYSLPLKIVLHLNITSSGFFDARRMRGLKMLYSLFLMSLGSKTHVDPSVFEDASGHAPHKSPVQSIEFTSKFLDCVILDVTPSIQDVRIKPSLQGIRLNPSILEVIASLQDVILNPSIQYSRLNSQHSRH